MPFPWIWGLVAQNPLFSYSPYLSANLIAGTAERHGGRSLRADTVETVPPKGKTPETLYKWAGYLQKTFDSPEKMCYVNRVQGSDEDTPR